MSDLCGVEDVEDPLDHAVARLVLLADDFDVAQFAEVEVTLLLQTLHAEPHVLQLKTQLVHLMGGGRGQVRSGEPHL